MAESESYDFNNDPRIPCKYGKGCYRTNKVHFEKYKHPAAIDSQNGSGSPVRPKKKQKLNTFDSGSNKLNVEEKQIDSSPPKKERSTNSVSPRKLLNTEEIKETNSPVITSLREKVRAPETKKVDLKSNHKELIKQLFLVDMPDDFYSFWELCGTLCKSDPSNALKDIKLKLVGPFDVLAGMVTEVYEEDLSAFLRHWRFYYDPPEFQTVVAGCDARCYHMGYYRDDPNELPVFVASNVLNSKNPEKNGELKIMGPNLFAALNAYLEEMKTDPFSRMKVLKFQKAVANWAKEKGFSLEKSSKQMESRSRRVVAKTFHGAGIFVTVDKKNDVGYRELAASNAMIKKILKGIVDSKSDEEKKVYLAQLQPVITFANIANDECDFGTSLELGVDLFTYGSPLLHRSVLQLLTTSYNLLGRSQFARIIEAHLEDRREGRNLSIL